MELTFLGTSAGVPTKERNVTSIILNLVGIRKGYWLFDCGEGTQHRILNSPFKTPKNREDFYYTFTRRSYFWLTWITL
ncbi:Ribonuclease BN [Providencia alcalifaciens]|nr:Ribonuclease BN [Providencia alcalifaciens]